MAFFMADIVLNQSQRVNMFGTFYVPNIFIIQRRKVGLTQLAKYPPLSRRTATVFVKMDGGGS